MRQCVCTSINWQNLSGANVLNFIHVENWEEGKKLLVAKDREIWLREHHPFGCGEIGTTRSASS